jgi:hypothetical protein
MKGNQTNRDIEGRVKDGVNIDVFSWRKKEQNYR